MFSETQEGLEVLENKKRDDSGHATLWRCGLEEYKNEFLNGLVGHSVLVRQLTGPTLDEGSSRP